MLLVILLITIPFLYHYTEFVPTSDNELVYLRDSQSLSAYETLKKDFPIGRMDPYSIIMSTDSPNPLLTQDYFDVEKTVIKYMLDKYDGEYLNRQTSVIALSYFGGVIIDFSTALAFLDSTINPTVYNSLQASAYRTAYTVQR